MGERRINFGSDGTDARYRVEDTGTGANFTVVEDLNGNTVVLQYDQTNLVGGVPLDLSGQDLLGTDIVDGTNINLSDIAGDNITVDTGTDELDGQKNEPGFQEDDNSPFTVTNSASKQFTLANDWDRIEFYPKKDDFGFDSLQVNGDTNSNYEYVFDDGTETTSTEFDFGAVWHDLSKFVLTADHVAGQIHCTIHPSQNSISNTGPMVYGQNTNESPPINTFTVFKQNGNTGSGTVRAFGLDI